MHLNNAPNSQVAKTMFKAHLPLCQECHIFMVRVNAVSKMTLLPVPFICIDKSNTVAWQIVSKIFLNGFQS